MDGDRWQPFLYNISYTIIWLTKLGVTVVIILIHFLYIDITGPRSKKSILLFLDCGLCHIFTVWVHLIYKRKRILLCEVYVSWSPKNMVLVWGYEGKLYIVCPLRRDFCDPSCKHYYLGSLQMSMNLLYSTIELQRLQPWWLVYPAIPMVSYMRFLLSNFCMYVFMLLFHLLFSVTGGH